MEELEFAKELIKIIDTTILQRTLKKAATKGFSVQGFNKNVWTAPITLIIGALDKKRRGGNYQYRIFLESLALYPEQTNTGSLGSLSISSIV